MIEHYDALRARLDVANPGAGKFLVWASGTGRYYVISFPAFSPSDERGICSTTDVIDTPVRLKAVTGTPEGVLTMLTLARNELSPGGASTALVVAGRNASIRFERSEFVDVDDSTTITDTDRHPAVGVDTYRLVSQPA